MLNLEDDAELRACYDIERRAGLAGREGAPFWTYDAYVGLMRAQEQGEKRIPLIGFVDGVAVGWGSASLFLLDNLTKSWIEVHVDPDHQRRGYGSQLMEALLREAQAEGRTEHMIDTTVPVDQAKTHGYSQFLMRHGFEYSNIEIVRYLELPIAAETLDTWSAKAAQKHDGYRIETFFHDIPEELIPSLCTLLGLLGVDAPTGECDWEEEVFTPERFAELQKMISDMGRIRLETLAIAPDGTVAAQSTLCVPTDGVTDAWQWGTFVHRDHRGKSLGLATKAANLRVLQEKFPEKTRVSTQNAESNDYMVAINKLIGFKIVEASVEFLKRDETATAPPA